MTVCEEKEILTREDALLKLQRYFVRGVFHPEHALVSQFFAPVRKVVADLQGAHAAVVLSKLGISLVIDRAALSGFNDRDITLTLTHELWHLLNMHFARIETIAGNLGIPLSEFQQKYVKYADLPVNAELEGLPAYPSHRESMLTYERFDLRKSDFPTFESLVRHFLENPEPPTSPPVTVIMVDDDGLVSPADGGNGGGDGTDTVVLIPGNDPGTLIDNMTDVAELATRAIEGAGRLAGSRSAELLEKMRAFIDEVNAPPKGWELIKRYLTGFRSVPDIRERTNRRPNRHTGLFPGRKKGKGFRALFIVDESGSMSDDEVNAAFALFKKTVLRRGSDLIYLAHWDTGLVGDIDIVRNRHQMESISRKARGGTNFQDVFSHEKIRSCDVDLAVFVTDGEPSRWPDSMPAYPVVWIVTTSQGFARWQKECGRGVAADVSDDLLKR